jgi:hypothetical protein
MVILSERDRLQTALPERSQSGLIRVVHGHPDFIQQPGFSAPRLPFSTRRLDTWSARNTVRRSSSAPMKASISANSSGWPQACHSGKAGAEARLAHGEVHHQRGEEFRLRGIGQARRVLGVLA